MGSLTRNWSKLLTHRSLAFGIDLRLCSLNQGRDLIQPDLDAGAFCRY